MTTAEDGRGHGWGGAWPGLKRGVGKAEEGCGQG